MRAGVVLVVLVLMTTATGLALVAERARRQVVATAAAVERLRLLHLATDVLRSEAGTTRAAVDETGASVGCLGHR